MRVSANIWGYCFKLRRMDLWQKLMLFRQLSQSLKASDRTSSVSLAFGP